MITCRTALRCAHSIFLIIGVLAVCTDSVARAQAVPDEAPTVTKVEPPSWWVNLTPDLLVMITGDHLLANHVSCNIPEVVVSRTESTAGGNYLFVWIKFAPGLKSGTAICRVTTPHGQVSFELPLAARKQILGRNQGLTQDDVLYLIMPDRFANGDPSNDEPAGSSASHDRLKPRAYHGGDLKGIRDHLPYLKDLGITTIWLTPIVKMARPRNITGTQLPTFTLLTHISVHSRIIGNLSKMRTSCT